MEKKELEIMAPAGGFDCLQAAIQGGANAVYFGIGRLNMRSRSASNFLPEDLPEVVRICREAGVRSYLTLNITLFQDDPASTQSSHRTSPPSSTAGRSGWRSTFPRSFPSPTPRRSASTRSSPTWSCSRAS